MMLVFESKLNMGTMKHILHFSSTYSEQTIAYPTFPASVPDVATTRF